MGPVIRPSLKLTNLHILHQNKGNIALVQETITNVIVLNAVSIKYSAYRCPLRANFKNYCKEKIRGLIKKKLKKWEFQKKKKNNEKFQKKKEKNFKKWPLDNLQMKLSRITLLHNYVL